VQIYCSGQRLEPPEYIEDTPKPIIVNPEPRSIAEQIALPSPKPQDKTRENRPYYLKGGDRRELIGQCAQVTRKLVGQNIVINFNDNKIGNKKFSIQDFDRVVLSPQKGNQQSALQFFEKDQINSSFTYLLQNDSRISIIPNPNGNEEKDKNLITRFSFENFPETFQEIQKKLFQYMIPPFSNPGDDFSKYPNVIFKIYPKGNNEHYKFRCKALDDFRPYRNTLVISYIRNGQAKQYSIGFNKNSNYKIEVAVFKKPE